MRTQPRAQQRPEALDGVDMDLVEAIAVFVAGRFASAMADAVVLIAPVGPPCIDVVLIGVEPSALADAAADDRLDGLLLHVLQHRQHQLAAALDQPQNRRLLLV